MSGKVSGRPMELRFIYTTLPDLKVAEDIARVLVGEGLAACVNLMPGLRSVYEWEGRIETSDEIAAYIKTAADRAAAVRARLAELHPYEVPAILTLPIEAVNEDYGAWALRQTETAGRP